MCERFRNDPSFDTDIILGDTDIRRYGIYYCNLEEDLNPDSNNRALIGKCNRPCMVITPTNYNRKKNKIIVIPFCSNNTDLSDEEFVESSYKMADRDILIPIKLNRDEMSFLVVSQPREIYKRNIGRYIGRLDKINKSVDELVKMRVPFGEQEARYETLVNHLSRAGVLHSQILKELKG